MNKIINDFVGAIGNTPLIKLNGPSEESGCNIYGKAEFLNPGGSIKDKLSIDYCNKNSLSMVFTGNRHFKH